MKTLEACGRLKIFQRPMCLISTTDDGKLKLEEEPLADIEKIDMPLVVVAIAGLYRTGKSYLMNCLAGETKGFPLGNTTESKTKGIWAWCRIHPEKEDQVLLLLDTEGLGDIAKGDTDHDNKIFTIAALLCNVLVYNMMSAFNQDAVEKLTFISEMSKHITFASGEMKSDEKFDLILPLFVLCLRDFILDIEKDGEEMTTDEYLDDCLELKAGKGKDIDKFNRPRECIRKYFPKRKCFTFDRPGNKSVMKRLETASTNELSEDFREETAQFLNYIYSCKPKVLLSSKSLRGKMFATLATSYINAISSGAIPDVDDAIQMVAKMENERMARAAVEEFKTKLQTIKLPVLRIKDFNKLYEDIQNVSLANFRSEALFETEHFEQRAIDEMDKLWKLIKEQNCELIKHYCMDQLREIYGKIVRAKRDSGKYLVSGGYEEYREDIAKVKRQYRKKMTELEKYEVTQSLNEFIDDEADFESEVLLKDKKISEEERKKEIENLKKDNQESYTKQQKLFEQKMTEEKRRTEEHYKKLESERGEYMRREEEKMQLLMGQWKEQKEISEKQIEMMKTENEKQRQGFRDEIQQLNEANSRREIEHKIERERILKQEREFNKTQLETMKKGFEDLFETQKKEAEQKQAEERKQAEEVNRIAAERLKEEKERNEEQKRAHNLQMQQMKDDRQNHDQQMIQQMTKMQTENERQHDLQMQQKKEDIGRHEQQMAKMQTSLNQMKEDQANIKSENERLKNRGVLDRLFNN